MKQLNTLFGACTLVFALCISTLSIQAQINQPRGSQQATVSQRVGTSDVSITYSRPSVNGRDVYGNLVPYGMNNLGFGTSTAAPWRAGANENTTITFSHDAKVEGKDIKAGTYGLHIEVKEGDQAILILSHDANAWGSFYYDASHDALKADITTKTVPSREVLTFEFNTVAPTSTVASLVWGTREFPFTIAFAVSDIVLNEFRDKSIGNLGFNRQNWEQAANFSQNNEGDLNEALGWIDGAIAGNFYSQKTFNNLAIKGQILNKMGKTDEYDALLDEAAGMANVGQLNALGYQMLGAKDNEKAIKYFKQNVESNPENANGYDSLGDGYKAAGDSKNAIKNYKKALTLNPAANVKAASEASLKELGAL